MLAQRQHQQPSLLETVSGLRWQPGRDTLVAVASYILLVGLLYTAFQLITTERVAANFITYGPVGLALAGIGIPVFYTTRLRGRSLDEVGITSRHLLPSLALGLILGYDTYRHTLGTLGLTWERSLVPLVTMSLAVGLFEAVFFRGWLQLRFEDAFGTVPGLLLGALCYSLYHVGYGMETTEMVALFFFGLTFGAMFRLTKNVFVLWPFYTPIGGLYSTASDGLTMPFEATYGFLITLAMMVAIIAAGRTTARRREL
ncbi:MAG: CPBP family intramembrane glutamic endopeptidase [Anaerolineae bacterium]|nr:CPBP family intramembrane glutamic endopeptidase [Anaerolineae bacterium]